MAILISKDELKLYKNDIPCKCENCESPYFISKSDAYRNFKGTRKSRFCSHKCRGEFTIKEVSIPCKCNNCNKDITKTPSTLNINNFCSQSCAAIFNNVKRGVSNFDKRETCLRCDNKVGKGSKKFCSLKCSAASYREIEIDKWLIGEGTAISGKALSIKAFIRKYLISKSNNMCSKCGWNTIHEITKKCPLEINHIDGNAANDRPENLEVLCPNCHSLTSNFRALNKNSPRVRK